MNYIMLGRRKNPRIYAISGTAIVTRESETPLLEVSIGVPPYYSVTGIDNSGNLILEELPPDSNESRKVNKWVGEYHWGEGVSPSRLLLHKKPVLTEEQVIKFYSE